MVYNDPYIRRNTVKFILGNITGIIIALLSVVCAVSTVIAIVETLGLAKLALAYGPNSFVSTLLNPFDKLYEAATSPSDPDPEPNTGSYM